ncbi:MAG: DUF1826 domain-containing protein [Pseudomonadota bacterium]
MSELAQSSAEISVSSNVFRAIGDPECNLAIWQRDIAIDLSDFVANQYEEIRFDTPLDQLRPRLNEELLSSKSLSATIRDQLIEDVEMLGRKYCSILDLSALEVRLEIVSTDACRKWHSDYVKARLITTYAGTGTQWLTSDDANRVKRNQDPARINTMSSGDVGIFKGKLATDNPVVHRSPPIAGTGERRLLLVLNPPPEN